MLTIKILLSSLFLLQFSSNANGDTDEKCLDMVQELISSQMGKVVPCINELGLTIPKSRAENYNCIMRCILMKAGMLTTEGKISVIQAVSFGLERIPTEYIEKALFEISKCVEFASLVFGDETTDVGCKKMKPLVDCGVDFMFNICK